MAILTRKGRKQPGGIAGRWDSEQIKTRIGEIELALRKHDKQMARKLAGKSPKEGLLSVASAKRQRMRMNYLIKAKDDDAICVGGQQAPMERGRKQRREGRDQRRDDLRKARMATKARGNGESVECLRCGSGNHLMTSCSKNKSDGNLTGICFNCGNKGHNLRDCPDPRPDDGSVPFASCYLCGEKHLSSECPQGRGKYPSGGGCHDCGSKLHLVRDCPKRLQRNSGMMRRVAGLRPKSN